jgi:hypothetical protein
MRSYIDRSWRLILASWVIALCWSGQAGAVTVTLEASQDNTLYESPVGDLSNGAGQHFFAGRTGQGGSERLTRGLIRFDVARLIPPGSIINSVELHLNASTPMSRAGTVSLHPVLAPWGEGQSAAAMGEGGGAAATIGDATWIHTHFDTAFWASAGGDFEAEPSASFAVTGNGPQLIGSTPGIVGDVQAWVDDPASNNGWLVRHNDEVTAPAIRFDSRQNANPAAQPRLAIDFSLPPLLISPPSGIFALTQVTDIAVFVNLPPGSMFTSTSALLDGVDVTGRFTPCFLSAPGTVVAGGGLTFRCPAQSFADMGPGRHRLQVIVGLGDGTSLQQTVDWLVLENAEP